MDGNTASVANAKAAKDSTEARQRSTIGFPYMSLGDAIEVAEAIHTNVGLGECDGHQLAVWMKQSAKSSTFRIQLSASKMFGVIEPTSGRWKLTDLGRAIVDPAQARAAKVRAFLNVPLYKTVYEEYKSGLLPPTAAFERDIANLGVAEKQKERARQVLERSADQAGFCEHGKNRLVMPGIAVTGEQLRPQEEEKTKESRIGGGGGGSDLSPFIQGLLNSLPNGGKLDPNDPKLEWPVPDRVKWLQTAANIFDLMYKGEGGVEVRSALANRSPRPE